MTEKTFRDMLPLSDEQRDFLKSHIVMCGDCPLCSTNNGAREICSSFVGTNNINGKGCHNVRAAAIRLDDEFRERDQKDNKLLTQDKVQQLRDQYGGFQSVVDSHGVALDEIERLKKVVEGLGCQIDRRDFDWDIERTRYDVEVTQLRVDIESYEAREEQLENGWCEAEGRYEEQLSERDSEIDRLESEIERMKTEIRQLQPKPEIKPPAMGRFVIDENGEIFYSYGEFNSEGILTGYRNKNDESIRYLVNWRDLLDPNHHSDGWKEEWKLENGS